MAETVGSRLQHEMGADFKVPLPMFSGRNDDSGWSGQRGSELTQSFTDEK